MRSFNKWKICKNETFAKMEKIAKIEICKNGKIASKSNCFPP